MKDIEKFVGRLKKIGIDVELTLNHPWIYLDKINGKQVTEVFFSNYFFTFAFAPVRYGDEKVKFIDLEETFKVLRKYGR